MKSRICIVTTRTINDSPCLDKYKNIIDRPYDIIYWAKGEKDRECGATNVFKYEGVVPTEGGKIQKILHYLKFTRFVKKIIRNNQYEKLIIYPTQMAWMIRGLLKGKYKGKYLYDIRDYVGEDNKIIGKLTAEAVNNAGLCSITCPAYRKFLPDRNDYVISHNIQPIDEEIVQTYRSRGKHEGTIRLSFIGTVRFFPQLERIIKVFGNDERFSLHFIGRGSEKLKEFCEKGNYLNVELIGQFDRSELGQFYLNSDMAINLYGNDRPALVYALSNKLYSAALMGMPLLASPGTYTAEIVDKYGIGFVVDLDDKLIVDQLYKYYRDLNYNSFLSCCNQFIEQVKCQEDDYSQKVYEYIVK